MDEENEKCIELPLLLPLGMIAREENTEPWLKEFDTSCHNAIENISVSLRRIVLNNFGNEIDENDEWTQEPERMLRVLMTDLIRELQFGNNGKHSFNLTDARRVRKIPHVVDLFKRTAILAKVDIVPQMTTIDETTCFLINVTNLMWIHALIFTDEDTQKGLLLKNWPLRHIYFDSVGYNIGNLGFVSLHDLHSALFGLPSIFRSENLNSLNFLSDARIYFLVAQPTVYSPKIELIDPAILDSALNEMKDDYLRRFVVVKDMKLYIPVPFFLYLERLCYDFSPQSKSNSSCGLIQKQNMLIDVLKYTNLPYEKLLTRDMYIVNDTQFKIKFSHSVFELEEMVKFNKTVWRACHMHKSLFECLGQHVNIVRSTMLEDHYSEFSCHCENKSSEMICFNNSLLRMAKIFQPLFDKFSSDTDYSNKGLRCLYASLAFTIGAAKYSELDNNAENNEEAARIYQLAETVFMNYSTDLICEKMKMCTRVILTENDLYLKWPHWYDLFFDDPNDVLTEIVNRENGALACEWVAVQIKYEPNFHFAVEARNKFLALLSGLEDTSYLKRAFQYTCDIPMLDIIDHLIQTECPVSKLISLVTTVIEINNLNDTEMIKFHSLLIGFKMISRIFKFEQIYYYPIAYNPLLIVEQLILNKKVATLKEMLNEVIPLMEGLPERLKQVECLSRPEIDELLKSYAEKALHFRKKTTPSVCKYAALLHAYIFKDTDNFHPPEKIPTEDNWIPNNWAVVCLCCQKEFTVFTRRHHCRRCGRVICHSCSSRKLKLATYESLQRVCDQCFKFENEFQSSPLESSSQKSVFSGEEKGRKPIWTLSLDPASNECIKKQAVFETAPDIELCLSLLELHTESISVPRFLFTNAQNMLKILRQRLVCPANFDYPEVTHIVKSLSLAAKVYFTHLGDVQGTRSCEDLTDEADLLNQLAKFAPLEPAKPIRDVQDWKQIRNVLLEQQKWELALEISTKNGLECGSIWYLWGMHILKSGDWATARDKFSRSNLKKNPKMLTSVLELIYSSVDKETNKLFAKFFLMSTKKTSLPEKVYEECIYYLKNYGSGDQLFDFYIENERVFDAVHVAFSKKIAPKKFVHQIYIPYVKNNNQTKILKYMETADKTLIGWKDIINEICVYCTANKHFDVLYETQLWIKDYQRAAISCTLFYKTQAKCYASLVENSEHLQSAISHFQTAISRFTNGESTELELVVDSKKIQAYIDTAYMQLEISRLICRNSIFANQQFETVPTLLGADSEKVDVMFMVFESVEDEKEAFSCLFEIMNICLSSKGVIVNRLAAKMMEEKKEDSVIKLMQHVKKVVHEPATLIDSIARVAILAKPVKADVFLQSITNNDLKFEMSVEIGFLKSAYLLAVKMKRKDYVEKIYQVAKSQNKTSIEKICLQHLGRQPTK